LSPRQARREFLNSKKGSIKESSRRAYKYPTKSFVEFCEEHGIETTGEVDGYVLTSWKERRRQEIKPITLHNNVKHLRVFLKWAARSELMERHIYEKLAVPDVPDDEVRSHAMLDLEQAEATLRYLKTYEYATRKHAMFYTLWHTGCRVSGAISLDVEDVVNQSGDYIITFRNRRSTGTALKNGNNGERNVSITDSLWNVLQDYLEGPHRNQVEDEYGRKPLFTTPKNRISRGTAYKDYTAITRPCVVTSSCPHNRLIDDCEAAQRKEDATKCMIPQKIRTLL